MDTVSQNRRKNHILSLRRRAEEILASEGKSHRNYSADEIRQLVHDLHVYQIEIEMQNDELFRSQSELTVARDEYLHLYNDAPVGYANVDSRGRIQQCNETLCTLFDREHSTIVGALLVDFIHPNDRDEFLGRFRAFFNRPEGKEIDVRLSRDQSETHVVISGRRAMGLGPQGHDENDYVMIALTDISESKKLELELSLAAKVFENSIEGILVTDRQGRILRVNDAFTVVTGYRQEEVLGKNPSILKSDHQDPSFYEEMWNSLVSTGSWQGEIVNKRKNGESYVEWLSISSITGHNGEVVNFVGIFSDITEKKLNTQQMQQLAYNDVLTGLPNRTLYYDRLKQALVRAKRHENCLAILFIDLDNFKELNDTHGHAAGDDLLRQVSRRLLGTVRSSDTVARLGGDEFTLILGDIRDVEQASLEASRVAENILEAIARPYDLEILRFRVSASIGIAIYPQDGNVLSDLVKHADTAMYQAKSGGRNTFRFFSQQMYEAQRARTLLARSLHNALADNDFTLHYQPIVDLSRNRVSGFEALIRWNHPERGELPPNEFIPLAEETGQILALGRWVIQEAIGQLKIWRHEGWTDLFIAINLSVRQLLDPNLPLLLDEILVESQVPAELVHLEITETAMLKDSSEIASALQLIKRLGVRVSLDDFGTGYSSLSYVKIFPMDTIKIDRTFVRDIFISLEDRSIVLASISLANSLNVATVAEGVETEEQLEFLFSQGCYCLQGYLISRPLPAPNVAEFLSRWAAGRPT